MGRRPSRDGVLDRQHRHGMNPLRWRSPSLAPEHLAMVRRDAEAGAGAPVEPDEVAEGRGYAGSRHARSWNR